jgi:hypothetical protein
VQLEIEAEPAYLACGASRSYLGLASSFPPRIGRWRHVGEGGSGTYELAGGVARVTGESGRERVRALGKVVILPVSAQHDGWTVRSTRAGETAGFQASQTWHWSEDTYEGANDGRCAHIYGITLGGLGRSSARVEFPSNYTGLGLSCAHRRPRGRKRDGAKAQTGS